MNTNGIIFKDWKINTILNWDFSRDLMHTRRLVKQEVREKRDVAPAMPLVGYKGGWVQPFMSSPYGRIGDLLWVRECARLNAVNQEDDGKIKGFELRYRADDSVIEYPMHTDHSPFKFTRWNSSIHMPMWATRLWLQVMDIRVERLQKITREDAIREGADGMDSCYKFSQIWDSINRKPGTRWDDNPWVWVIAFKRHAGPFYMQKESE